MDPTVFNQVYGQGWIATSDQVSVSLKGRLPRDPWYMCVQKGTVFGLPRCKGGWELYSLAVQPHHYHNCYARSKTEFGVQLLGSASAALVWDPIIKAFL
jgi:hypothetical protein